MMSMTEGVFCEEGGRGGHVYVYIIYLYQCLFQDFAQEGANS